MTREFNAGDTTTAHEVMLAALLRRHRIEYVPQWEFTGANGYHGYADFYLPMGLARGTTGLRGFVVEVDGHPVNLQREAALWSLGVVPIHLQNEPLHTADKAKRTVDDLMELVRVVARIHVNTYQAAFEKGRALAVPVEAPPTRGGGR